MGGMALRLTERGNKWAAGIWRGLMWWTLLSCWEGWVKHAHGLVSYILHDEGLGLGVIGGVAHFRRRGREWA